MKLSKLRVANAILVGNETMTYFTDKTHDIVLDGVVIWITCKRSGHKILTSLFNVPYGEAAQSVEPKTNTTRSAKTKGE